MIEYNKDLKLFIRKDEKKLIKYIAPSRYIKRDINKIDQEYLISFIRDELKDLLQSFLNGGLSKKGFIFYPLIKDVSFDNKKRLEFVFKIAERLRRSKNWFLESTNLFSECKKIRKKDFAQLISALYKDLDKIKKRKVKEIKKELCEKLEIKGYEDKAYIKPIFELKDFSEKKMRRYLSGFYLHGSLSTKDYVKGWSDLDTLIIVNKKTISDPKSLVKLRDHLFISRKFFYMIDPLQHHSHSIISENYLENYSEEYFPSKLFLYSKSFFDKEIISKIKIRKNQIRAVNNIFYFVNYFREVYFNKRYKLSSYETKFLFHAITLFPTLYLQAKGIHVYKKFSFDIAKKDFTKENWDIIKKIEKVRSRWVPQKRSIFTYYSKINPVLAYQLNYRFMDLFDSIVIKNKIDTARIIKAMFKLSEKAWSKIKCRIKDMN